MKQIKVGQINFYKNDLWGDTGEYRIRTLIDYFNKFSNKYYYEYFDCQNNECDIVFYSLYDRIEQLKLCKGNPIFIYWTDELYAPGSNVIYENPFIFYKQNNLSISFNIDSNDNCYFPYGFLDNYDNTVKSFNDYKVNINDKTRFATFCASNSQNYNAKYRMNVVKYISQNYKQITCCGKVLNNTDGEYLPFDTNKAIDYHKSYKFNFCFENAESKDNPKYITEKIMNAFMYRTIPIYWGCENINDFFNKEAFINCNGLSYEEILQKIIEVDNNNELYEYMINQYPFKFKSINYREYFFERIMKFIEDHLL